MCLRKCLLTNTVSNHHNIKLRFYYHSNLDVKQSLYTTVVVTLAARLEIPSACVCGTNKALVSQSTLTDVFTSDRYLVNKPEYQSNSHAIRAKQSLRIKFLSVLFTAKCYLMFFRWTRLRLGKLTLYFSDMSVL